MSQSDICAGVILPHGTVELTEQGGRRLESSVAETADGSSAEEEGGSDSWPSEEWDEGCFAQIERFIVHDHF